jgi:hypothetical protein
LPVKSKHTVSVSQGKTRHTDAAYLVNKLCKYNWLREFLSIGGLAKKMLDFTQEFFL